MYKIGGYALPFEDTIAWAKRRYPDIDIYDKDVICLIIEDHAEDVEGLKFTCLPTIRDDQLLCVFVTHSANDPYATRTRFTPFPLDDHAVEFGQKLFPLKEDSDKAKFVTICDPCDRYY